MKLRILVVPLLLLAAGLAAQTHYTILDTPPGTYLVASVDAAGHRDALWYRLGDGSTIADLPATPRDTVPTFTTTEKEQAAGCERTAARWNPGTGSRPVYCVRETGETFYTEHVPGHGWHRVYLTEKALALKR